ncbi:MAG: exodeoxyribonuclease III [Legionellales bacterium]|nr:exodeoxyribonuclease III [Legionellales bacterium]
MRIISVNLNGIRAAARKGFFDWLKTTQADVVCIQETKAQEHQLADPMYCPAGYHCYYFDAEKKGYSGVALYAKQEPKSVTTGLGWEIADSEGRYIEADFGKLCVASLYLPSGSSSDERQARKYEFMDYYYDYLAEIRRKKSKHYIICGDWNIAHKEIDLKNWRANQKNSGFLPDEREWLDKVFDLGFVDAFREVNQAPDQYTWWSNRGQAWAKNVGWRIDYQIVSPQLKPKIQTVSIYKDERFSDHAPLLIEYEGDLS